MGDPNTGEIYRDIIRKPDDVGLSEIEADRLRQMAVDERMSALNEKIKQREAAKPDLRTLEGALSFLDYHAPNEDTLPRHYAVNSAFQSLCMSVWNAIPDGPGKTVALRAIGRARMECNSAIANGGQ